MSEPPKKQACEDDLLEQPTKTKKMLTLGDLRPQGVSWKDIDGLCRTVEFISQEEETNLLAEIAKLPWSNELQRRTQQYGYKYDFSNKSGLTNAQPVPEFLQVLQARLHEKGIIWPQTKMDQVIVNEYRLGQKIASHTDSPLFGDEIVSISLGAPAKMLFSKGNVHHCVSLPRCSVLRMKGAARNDWAHSLWHTERDIRVSITFRSKRVV